MKGNNDIRTIYDYHNSHVNDTNTNNNDNTSKRHSHDNDKTIIITTDIIHNSDNTNIQTQARAASSPSSARRSVPAWGTSTGR